MAKASDSRARFSNTMRINLLPDVGGDPVKQGQGHRGRMTKTGSVQQASPYADFLESIYDAAIISDAKGNVIEFNGRALAFLNYSSEEMAGLHISTIIAGADETTMQQILENLAAERFTVVQAYCLRSDRSYFPAEIAVSRMRMSNEHFCMLVRNITVRRAAEEQLLVEHNALQHAGNGIVITDLQGTITYANPALYGMLGETSSEGQGDELKGSLISEIGSTSDLSELLDRALADGGGTFQGEVVLKGVSEEVICQVAVAANWSSEDELVGAVFSFADLRDRRAMEAARQEAEKQRVMLESMGAACHHLGQPATVLMTSMGLLRNRVGEDGPDVVDLLDRCDDMCARLASVLRRMQRLTKYQTMQYTEENAAQIVDIDELTQ